MLNYLNSNMGITINAGVFKSQAATYMIHKKHGQDNLFWCYFQHNHIK